jgi:hypothetical protein
MICTILGLSLGICIFFLRLLPQDYLKISLLKLFETAFHTVINIIFSKNQAMAISENFLLKKLSGHIGRQLVVKQYGDKTVISKFPDMSRRKLSPKQLAVNEKMKEANVQAKRIMADDELRKEAQVRLNVTRNKLYTSLIKEYFTQADTK